MKKRLVSILSAGAFLISSVNVLNAGAVATFENSLSPQYEQKMENYVEFEDDGFFTKKSTNPDNWTRCYYKKDAKDCSFVRIESYIAPKMIIRLRNNDDTELVSEIIQSYNSSYYIMTNSYSDITEYRVYDYSGVYKMMYHSKKIYQDLKELAEVVSFDYFPADGWFYLEERSFPPSITSYAYDQTKENKAEVLQQYIDDNNLDFTVVTYDYESDLHYYDDYIGCYLKPNYDIGFEEHLEIAKRIKNDLGYTYRGDVVVVPDSDESLRIQNIDVCNSIDGDSNDDGELTVADATLILQNIGNSDKYKLSPQGEFNADITGDGDGISALDALEIQKILADD
ncbi:MAG: dockerin type I repeat-containing protein [Ruminococcus sp.]|nr:dockerin type I repeat-containing protein [Ruminococcus sp.]MDE6784933.1 dockerin type I repeat-containing protein [Ruminococcus sp.]